MGREECLKFEGLLYDFADGLLSEVDRLKVEEHCTLCVECSSIVAEIRVVTSAAESMPELAAPADKMWIAIDSRIKSGASVQSPVKEPVLVPGGVLAGLFSSIYSQARRARLIAVPVLVTGFVLFAIFPFWVPEKTNPFMPEFNSPSGGIAETLVFVEGESLSRDMSEASSEARWNLLEDTFSDVMLDEVTSDIYSGWD